MSCNFDEGNCLSAVPATKGLKWQIAPTARLHDMLAYNYHSEWRRVCVRAVVFACVLHFPPVRRCVQR